MAQQPPRLSSALVVRKEDVPESAKPPTAPPMARISMTYRPRQDVHERLRAIGFNERRPVQALIDEAVEAWLDTKRP